MLPTGVCFKFDSSEATDKVLSYLKEHREGTIALHNGLTYGKLFSILEAYEIIGAYLAYKCGVSLREVYLT